MSGWVGGRGAIAVQTARMAMSKRFENARWLSRLSALLAVLLMAVTTAAQPASEVSESMPLGAKPEVAESAVRPRGDREAETGLLGNSFVRTAGSLALVLGLIFLLATVTKKLTAGKSGLGAALGVGGPSPAGVLEVLGRYPLGRGHMLILLKVDNRVLLLAQSSGGVRLRGASGSLTTLCEISSPEEVASILLKTQDLEDQSVNARFRAMLSEADSRHDGVVDLTRGSKRNGEVAGATEANWIEETFETPAKPPVRSSSVRKGGRA